MPASQERPWLICGNRFKEINVVRAYFLTVAAYLTNGTQFDAVQKAAGKLSYSKPLPDTVNAPKGAFSKALIEAYDIV